MTNAPTNADSNSNAAAAKPQTAVESKQNVLKEIGAKWGKFSEHDLSVLKPDLNSKTVLVRVSP